MAKTSTTQGFIDPIEVYKPLLSEVFLKVHNAKTKPQKVKILQENDSPALRSVCKWSFDPEIESDLPEGAPPYIPNEAPEGTEHTRISSEHGMFFNFIKGANGKIQSSKKENMFVRLLEGLHKDEAKLLIIIKDKQLHKVYKGLSEPVVKEAFGWDDDFNKLDV